MLSTEVQRIILLIGLAVTGYLMILAWNDDYLQKPADQSYSEAPVVPGLQAEFSSESVASEASGQNRVNDSELPVDSSAGSGEGVRIGDGGDIPDDSLLVAAGDTGSGQSTEEPRRASIDSPGSRSSSGDRLIRIKTDTLVMWVDRLGGDIVRAQLPLYPIDLDRPEIPVVLLDSGNNHTYIAQSGLIGPDGIDSKGARPLFVSDATEYDFTGSSTPQEVTLQFRRDQLEVSKTFRFAPAEYVVDVSYRVRNGGSRPLKTGLFVQLKRDDKEPEGTTSFAMGPRPYLGAALMTNESRYEKLKFDELEEESFREVVKGGWIAMLQHYFLTSWVGNPDENNRYYGQKRPDGNYIVGYSGPLREIAAGESSVFGSRFYAGPKDQDSLEKIAPNLNLTVDYGFLWWIAVPLFHLLQWLYGFLGNWGLAIIALTVIVKLVLFPLSAASYRSMANMKRVAPQMKKLQERYSSDRQKLSQEMMAFYKKEKVNPLGGCLPMLLPMPIFIALYWVLFESVELRQAPFYLWIHDMSQMDPYFVLPLLMGASMYFTQLLNPPPPDPTQAKVMKMMPIMFTVLFLFFPSGLVLYWLVNNLLSMGQQWYITRQIVPPEPKS